MCELGDVELWRANVIEMWDVNEDGDTVSLRATAEGEQFYAYFFCNDCQFDWVINCVQDRDKAWKLAKEHLNA